MNCKSVEILIGLMMVEFFEKNLFHIKLVHL